MSIKVFTESEVRAAFLKKAPCSLKASGKHDIYWLIVDGVHINFLKIPNNHNKDFLKGKANDLSKKMFLSSDEYNLFMKCTMKKKAYLDILKLVLEAKNKAELEIAE